VGGGLQIFEEKEAPNKLCKSPVEGGGGVISVHDPRGSGEFSLAAPTKVLLENSISEQTNEKGGEKKI